jgi:hypothetical protein
MNLRERLEIRGLVNLIISVIERLVNIIEKFLPKQDVNKPKPAPSPEPNKPHRPKPLKTIIDTIDNIVPWRKK